MTSFIKIGTLYVRPEDIVLFHPNSAFPEKTTVKFKNGTEWNITIRAEAIAALLNEVKP